MLLTLLCLHSETPKDPLWHNLRPRIDQSVLNVDHQPPLSEEELEQGWTVVPGSPVEPRPAVLLPPPVNISSVLRSELRPLIGPELSRDSDLIGWIRQLFHAIKTQLKAPKAPKAFLAFRFVFMA